MTKAQATKRIKKEKLDFKKNCASKDAITKDNLQNKRKDLQIILMV